jgi:hypothetical protein
MTTEPIEEAEELCPHQSGGYACQWLKGHYGGCVLGREAPYDYERRTIHIDRATVEELDRHLTTVYAGTGIGRSKWIRDAIKAENALIALANELESYGNSLNPYSDEGWDRVEAMRDAGEMLRTALKDADGA